MRFARTSFLAVVCLVSITPLPACLAQSPVPATPAMEQRASEMIAKMSLDDKLALIGGQDDFYTRAIPSIGLKRLKMSDGPVGVRTFGPTTAFTAGVALAASWDPELAQRVGAALGDDARARGVHFLLAPGVNIYRSPLNGRNMEYFGEDPFLAGRMAVGYINGVQSKGVSATVKHFAANNSEYDRHRINSIIDERTLRELYLPAFEAAVKEAHVGAVMDSYNLVNGEHSTQNNHLNNEILKNEWGFKGVLMSDWTATYDGVIAANAGLDLEMPFAKLMTPETLKAALKSGNLKESVIDDKVRRILRTAMQFGWLDRDQWNTTLPLYNLANDKVALDEARESITLLKNEGSLLPLDAKKIKTIAVLGPESVAPVVGGGGSSQTTPFFAQSFVAGFATYLGDRVKVMYVPGLPTLADMYNRTSYRGLTMEQRTDETWKNITPDRPAHIAMWTQGNNGGGAQSKEPTSYRWKGEYVPGTTGAYVIVVSANGQDSYRILIDGKEALTQKSGAARAETRNGTIMLTGSQPAKVEVQYETRSSAAHIGVGIRAMSEMLSPESQKIVREADAAVVAVGFDAQTESEGFDRTYTMPWPQNDLIAQVASLNPKTIVTVTAGGAVETAPWIGKVPVLLHNWYPGQEGARSLAEIVFGERSPEGHLPFSWEKTLDENPASAHYEEEGSGKDVHYAEGMFLGYRYYTSMQKQPLFPFGYGLSYTKFSYSHLTVKRNGADDVEVAFDVQNSGNRAGADVAQVYVGDPSAKVKRPIMELKQFSKVRLNAGAKQHVVLHLNRRAFSYYDVDAKDWRLDPGAFTIFVGDASNAVTLKEDVQMM